MSILVNITVLYKGFLTCYSLALINKGTFKAHLLNFKGEEEDTPPQDFTLYKEGRHWKNAAINQDLLDDIGYAAETAISNLAH